jgi:DNA-binding NtrC family response regulator
VDKQRILLVDDDKDLVNSFQSMLKGAGYYVNTALTAEQALEKAEKSNFDLAILDIVLPDMRGDTVAKELRKLNHEISIILITGYLYFQDCIDSINIGIHEILLKPIGSDELLRTTKEALSQA